MLNKFISSNLTRFALPLLLAVSTAMLTGCGGGGTGTTTTTVLTPTATTLSLTAVPTTVKSDNSNTSTISIVALDAGNAAIPNVTVNLSANTGVLSSASVVTDGTGKGTVTFSTGASRTNRTATITATAGAVTSQIPVQVVGTTVGIAATGTTIPDNGTLPVTLTVTVLDAGGFAVPNTAVTLTQAGTGTVTLTPTPATGITDINGKITVSVAGTVAGAVTVTATAAGATGTTALTVSPTAATFSIDQTTNGAVITPNPTMTSMKIGDLLVVQVNAPAPMANVMFATTTGTWAANNPSTGIAIPPANVISVPVCTLAPCLGGGVLGKAVATLTTAQTGIANVQVYDLAVPATSDTLTVAMTSGAPANSITLQPTPSVVPKSVGTTTGSSTLIATVRDAANLPVGNAPVAFSIVNPTGGGETISPVVVFTAATTAGGLNLGEARASFTSGTTSSGATGVQIRASVVGTAVSTQPVGVPNLTASGLDGSIVIGGTAGSIAFGQATSLATDATNANYILDMSILVADSNGNPAPVGTVVSLSAWPIAWSTGINCTIDTDAYVAPVGPATVGTGKGTFYNEDANENLILDAPGGLVEDGTRRFYTKTGALAGTRGSGNKNGFIDGPNSAGGTLPATVTTDASGVAAFKLTYTKSSAIWNVVRIRATTVVQGSSTMGEIQFRLDPTAADTTPCKLPNSPYTF